MTNVKKIKRAATVSIGVIVLVFLVWLLSLVVSIHVPLSLWAQEHFYGEVDEYFVWSAAASVAIVIPALMIAVVLGITLALLSAIQVEETPFHQKNVKRLKTMALLLILFEPISFIFGLIYLRNPIVVDGVGLATDDSFLLPSGGIVLVVGLIIYCVALVFQYGISLQTQVDETL